MLECQTGPPISVRCCVEIRFGIAIVVVTCRRVVGHEACWDVLQLNSSIEQGHTPSHDTRLWFLLAWHWSAHSCCDYELGLGMAFQNR